MSNVTKPERAARGPGSRRRLGELLTDAGVLTPDQLEEALASRVQVEGRRERVGEVVVRLAMASDSDIARALAGQLGLELVDGDDLQVDEEAARLIPATLAQRRELLPLRREPDGTLVVACVDPTNVIGLDDVRVRSGAARVRPVVTSASVAQEAIRRVFGIDHRAGELIDAIGADASPGNALDSMEADLASAAGDAPVARLLEGILSDALAVGASDVHVEPEERVTRVRYRVDGVLRQTMTVPRSTNSALSSRLKLMAGMDIAERRRPQDGRSRLASDHGEVDLRVSSLPSMHGETIVVRLLRKGAERLSMADLRFDAAQAPLVRGALSRPQGLVLLTGPTGSGKTSTLYAFLGELADESRNVITIEDPVEYELGGVNQTQVNDQIGLTFARSLRTVLRQDPDVVMVGEIRDSETAMLALQASLTGHLVFSTLHTNDAPNAVVRLRDLGVPPYLIASSLSLVVAQRLVRNVCPRCAAPVQPSEQQASDLYLAPADIDSGDFRRGQGCTACDRSGFRGRSGLFEMLPIDADVRDLVSGNASEAAIRQAGRRAGMRNLREDGVAKAMRGTTTLEEVARVTSTETLGAGNCPVCAQDVEDEFARCPWCGTDLRPDSCANCQRPLGEGWRICPSCGTPTQTS
ncbi:MAG: Flp pilus assembly complex ATPase component TadA [Actinobacteria bacterium]|nr:Flp pilus assembly complex ATPase component TadA [Actinomycetota bacterium]